MARDTDALGRPKNRLVSGPIETTGGVHRGESPRRQAPEPPAKEPVAEAKREAAAEVKKTPEVKKEEEK